MTANKKTAVSGIQASGNLHIGNYIGAIKQFVELQDEYHLYAFIADLHAITVPQDPATLRKNTLETVALYLACGLDPAKTTIFVQSHVPQHVELGWIFNTITPLGELERMAQFKEKGKINLEPEYLKNLMTEATKKNEEIMLGLNELKNENEISKREKRYLELLKAQMEEENHVRTALMNMVDNWQTRINIKGGLLNYPTLMTADILLYKPDAVPVGEDQRQHLELTRDLAKTFNFHFGEVFKKPEILLNKGGGRIMGLDDPTKKMSKSAKSKYNYINLLDSPTAIEEKIKAATTDSKNFIHYSPEKNPGISNLMVIYNAITNIPVKTIEEQYLEKGYSDFKKDLANIIIAKLSPIQEKFHDLMKDQSHLMNTLRDGAKKAGIIAETTMHEVRSKIGLLEK